DGYLRISPEVASGTRSARRASATTRAFRSRPREARGRVNLDQVGLEPDLQSHREVRGVLVVPALVRLGVDRAVVAHDAHEAVHVPVHAEGRVALLAAVHVRVAEL